MGEFACTSLPAGWLKMKGTSRSFLSAGYYAGNWRNMSFPQETAGY